MSQECIPHSDHPLITSHLSFSRKSSLVRRYCTTNKCINTKAAFVVLIWSFAINWIYALHYQPANHNALFEQLENSILTNQPANPDESLHQLEDNLSIILRLFNYLPLPLYGFNAILLCFYPMAGYLADIKFGRYKVLTKSLLCLIPSLLCVQLIVPIIYSFCILLSSSSYFLVLLVPLSCIGVFLFITINVNLVTFNANIIQFGIDQLFDSPGDHQSIFIYWYFWTYYVANFISQLGWTIFYTEFFYPTDDFEDLEIGIPILVSSWIMAFIVLIITSCIAWRKKQWFLKDTARMNPYKLVYKIAKFARVHKVPIRRSAFTYCEDEVPGGLDLGKKKYGGPYTTEQVEDVKAFYGILRILFAIGPLFFMEISINRVLFPNYGNYTLVDYYLFDNFIYNTSHEIDICVSDSTNAPASLFISSGLLTPFLIAASILAYLFFIRPFINYYKPRMLKYIGFGILLMLISVFCALSMDITNIKECFSTHRSSCELSTSIYMVEGTLYAFSSVLVYPALYQFICAQSPQSMKGLLIGLAFAIKGIFQLLAVLAVIIVTVLRMKGYTCEIDYYLLNILMGIISLAGFICAAKKYKLRERDEPCHVRRYVEEYYSKIPQ